VITFQHILIQRAPSTKLQEIALGQWNIRPIFGKQDKFHSWIQK